jgi:demethylmenaquinone methyltransferase/2-methoxy-6-polyprenyl-1,4-benzoquinol methylase
MTDPGLAEQIAYYRRRAPEYDATSYGDVAAAQKRITRLVAEMRPAGRVLEIACGTGMWTAALASHAGSVLAVDAAPEALEIARERVPAAGVTFEVADIFAWAPAERFDTIFFSAWLSHVPERRFDDFWRTLATLLAAGGRVLFVDEPLDEKGKESYVVNESETVERRLTDGTTFHIVKNFIDPDALRQRLHRLGWNCTTRRAEADWPWIYGEARPA